MSKQVSEDDFFEKLAAAADPAESVGPTAPPRLKARTYSALLRRQAESGPLLSLSESKAAGRGLCVFEQLVQIAPIGEKAKRLNICTVCHARALAERLQKAPIYWPNCPYSNFQKT